MPAPSSTRALEYIRRHKVVLEGELRANGFTDEDLMFLSTGYEVVTATYLMYNAHGEREGHRFYALRRDGFDDLSIYSDEMLPIVLLRKWTRLKMSSAPR